MRNQITYFFLNNFINLIMNKDQMYLTKIRELVQKLTIELTANGYHPDQINSYIFNSLKTHFMLPQIQASKTTTFQSFIKQLITRNKLSISGLLQLIIQFLQNQLMVACFQHSDNLQSQTTNIPARFTPERKPRKQKEIQKELNPQQLEQFMSLKQLKKQRKRRYQDSYRHRDYFDDYQSELNRQILEKMMLDPQINQELNEDFLQKLRLREQLAQIRGYADEDGKEIKRSNISTKKLNYFTT